MIYRERLFASLVQFFARMNHKRFARNSHFRSACTGLSTTSGLCEHFESENFDTEPDHFYI